ncbi:hypothetical protein CYMTET_31632, partial [Cymbomonas tetramitiformis]
YGLPVVAVESSALHCECARRRAAWVTRDGTITREALSLQDPSQQQQQQQPSVLPRRSKEKQLPAWVKGPPPRTVNGMISADMSAATFVDTYGRTLERGGADSSGRGDAVLVGLHTCGDLACSMLRVFAAHTTGIGAVIDVGCCYNLVSEVEEGDTQSSDEGADFEGKPQSTVRGAKTPGHRQVAGEMRGACEDGVAV